MSHEIEILASDSVGKEGIIQVSNSFMEEYFNVSRESLRKWEEKGCPKLARGKWDFIAVLRWRGGLDSLDTSEEESSKSLVSQKLKAEIFLKEQQGQLAEIELMKARGQLIEISEVEEIFGTVVSNAKTLFLSLPSKIAPKLLGVSVLDELRAVFAEYTPLLVQAKSKKDVNTILSDCLSELAEAKSLIEINDVVSRLVYEILEELSSVDIEQFGGDDS